MSIPYHDYMEREIEIKRFSLAAGMILPTANIIKENHQELDTIVNDAFNRNIANVNPEKLKASIKQLTIEFVICFCVDNFNNYLADTLRFIFLSRPETLRSSDKIEVSDVLKYSSIEEFTQVLAIKKADELTYGGIEKMKNFMTGTFGMQLDISVEDSQILKEVVATRNVIVHNRGKVNERFLKETRKILRVGDPVIVETSDLKKYWDSFARIAETIYLATSEKFGEFIFIESEINK